MRTKVRDFTVSTVHIFDHWETCIFDDLEHDSEVVDLHFSEESAEFEHDRWCLKVESPKFTLDDVRED